MPAEGKEHLFARQRLPLEGCCNFRDLGGIACGRGYQTAWGRLFRADELSGLTPSDQECLGAIPIVTVVDFRSAAEKEWHPDRPLTSVRHHYHFPIDPGSEASRVLSPDRDASRQAAYQGKDHSEAAAYRDLADMLRIYRLLVNEESICAAYRDFFRLIQQEDKLPVLFHCAAGKDRTGWAAFLILSALGAAEEDILENYLLSAAYIAGKYPVSPRYTVDAAYLAAACAEVNSRYGSMDNYLSQVLAVDKKRMRGLFLVPA
jgi:protein-tyrosine phosphatase